MKLKLPVGGCKSKSMSHLLNLLIQTNHSEMLVFENESMIYLKLMFHSGTKHHCELLGSAMALFELFLLPKQRKADYNCV